MDSTVPPSRPVAITVASEQEPIEVVGVYAEREGGFSLEFSIERDKFVIEHAPSVTRIAADGGLSYDISLTDSQTETLLSTPYGNIRFKVAPVVRDIVKTENGLRVMLKYILSSDASDDIERAVDITVRL